MSKPRIRMKTNVRAVMNDAVIQDFMKNDPAVTAELEDKANELARRINRNNKVSGKKWEMSVWESDSPKRGRFIVGTPVTGDFNKALYDESQDSAVITEINAMIARGSKRRRRPSK